MSTNNVSSSLAVDSAVSSNGSVKSRGRKSKLLPYLDEIRNLRNQNTTYKAIAEHMKSRGVDVNPVSIQIFAGKHGMTKKRDNNPF
jgi:hypothetical protein